MTFRSFRIRRGLLDGVAWDWIIGGVSVLLWMAWIWVYELGGWLLIIHAHAFRTNVYSIHF